MRPGEIENHEIETRPLERANVFRRCHDLLTAAGIQEGGSLETRLGQALDDRNRLKRVLTAEREDYECLAASARELDQHLGNLLARIHGDGGHYYQEHGAAKAVEDADAKWCAMKQRLDELEYQNAKLPPWGLCNVTA